MKAKMKIGRTGTTTKPDSTIKIFFKAGSLLILLVFLSSCAFHSGLMTGNASLSDPEFSIVDFAIGSSETVKVFGIGGLNADAVVLEAKRNLYENYPLEKGQALANVTVDFKREYYLIVSKLKVIISAEIVDFNAPQGEEIKAFSSLHEIENSSNHDFFKIGDEILFPFTGEFKKGKVTNISKKTITIRYYDVRNRLRTIKQPDTQIFLSGSHPGGIEFNVNEKVTVPVSTDMDHMGDTSYLSKDAVIIGLGTESALIEYLDDNHESKRAVKSYDVLKKN